MRSWAILLAAMESTHKYCIGLKCLYSGGPRTEAAKLLWAYAPWKVGVANIVTKKGYNKLLDHENVCHSFGSNRINSQVLHWLLMPQIQWPWDWGCQTPMSTRPYPEWRRRCNDKKRWVQPYGWTVTLSKFKEFTHNFGSSSVLSNTRSPENARGWFW